MAVFVFLFFSPSSVSAAMIGPMDDSLVSKSGTSPVVVYVQGVKYFVPQQEALKQWHPKFGKQQSLTAEQMKLWADKKASKKKATLPPGLFLVRTRAKDAQLFTVNKKGALVAVKVVPAKLLKKIAVKTPATSTPVVPPAPASAPVVTSPPVSTPVADTTNVPASPPASISQPVGTGVYRFTGGNDGDGWTDWSAVRAADFAAHPGLQLYFPGDDFGGFFKDYKKGSKQSIFGGGLSYEFNQQNGTTVEKENPSAPKTNLERIDVVVSTDPEDTKLSARAFAEAWITGVINAIKNAPAAAGSSKVSCEFGTPKYETKTLGGLEFVVASYLSACKAPGADGATWKVPTYAFAKGPSGNLLAMYFLNSNLEQRKPGANELDPGRDISMSFIEQFLSKVTFK